MKTPKFTFKIGKGTGKWAWTSNPEHYIKLDKMIVGQITHGTWDIRLKVMETETITDNNPNCSWKWITLTKKSSSLEEAKDFLNQVVSDILKKYTLHKSE